MNQLPLISVVIPVYGGEKFIYECIDSVLNQTYQKIECILVDGDSPDNCPQICEEYAKGDKRVKVIHKKNRGLSDDRNAGFRVSQGTYVTFVDVDDILSPDMILCLYQLCHKYDVLLAQCNHTTKRAMFDAVSNGQEKGMIIQKERCMSELFGKFGVAFCVSWGKLYHRTVLEKIEFPVGKTHEDVYTTHVYFESAKRLVFTKKRLYYYRQRKNSLMERERRKPAWNELRANMTRAAFFKEKKYLDAYEKQLWVCVCDLRKQYSDYYEVLSANRKSWMKKIYRKIVVELIKQKKRNIPIDYWILGRVKYIRRCVK